MERNDPGGQPPRAVGAGPTAGAHRTDAGRRRRHVRRMLAVPMWSIAAVVLIWAVHPWPFALRWADPSATAYMEHRERAAAMDGRGVERHWSWVELDELPDHLIRAVLIAEDHRFREHRGVDWEAVAEELGYRGGLPPRPWEEGDRDALRTALQHAREHSDRIRGRSTLSQQLARNLYLTPDRSLARKAQELLVARRLELLLSKDRILELYLNVAELGPGIWGVEAAAQAYFGRSARELTTYQAASLAATLPHPLTSNPSSNPGRMAWRRDLILERMRGPGPPLPVPAPVEILPPEVPPPPGEVTPSPDPAAPSADLPRS